MDGCIPALAGMGGRPSVGLETIIRLRTATAQPARYVVKHCPKCGSGSRVVLTREVPEGAVRRRACLQCDHRWYTLQPPEALLPNHRIEWLDTGRQISVRPPAGDRGG